MKPKVRSGRRCYICAPFAVDTSGIRRALHSAGIEIVHEKSTPPPGESPVGSILDMLRSVDFVCGVITAQSQIANVLFELGLAAGMQRSLLIVVDKTASIPVALESFPYVQAPLDDVSALKFQLDLFLKNLNRSNRAASRKKDVLPRDSKSLSRIRHVSNIQYPAGRDHVSRLEQLVADELARSGISVTLNPQYEVSGKILRPDIIAWVAGMPLEFGNPLIIEVKGSKASNVDGTIAQMTLYLQATRLRAGIILYDDPQIQRTVRLHEFYIFILPLELFLAAVKGGTVPQLLVSERNRLVHS